MEMMRRPPPPPLQSVHVDLEIPNVYYHLEQVPYLSQADQALAIPTPNDTTTTGSPIASKVGAMPSNKMTGEKSMGMEDVDQFMDSTLEGDRTKQFMGQPRWRADCRKASEMLIGVNTASLSITKMDYRMASALSRVATLQTSFQAT
jgi:hypothetical protein